MVVCPTCERHVFVAPTCAWCGAASFARASAAAVMLGLTACSGSSKDSPSGNEPILTPDYGSGPTDTDADVDVDTGDDSPPDTDSDTGGGGSGGRHSATAAHTGGAGGGHSAAGHSASGHSAGGHSAVDPPPKHTGAHTGKVTGDTNSDYGVPNTVE